MPAVSVHRRSVREPPGLPDLGDSGGFPFRALPVWRYAGFAGELFTRSAVCRARVSVFGGSGDLLLLSAQIGHNGHTTQMAHTAQIGHKGRTGQTGHFAHFGHFGFFNLPEFLIFVFAAPRVSKRYSPLARGPCAKGNYSAVTIRR